ncbi:DUF6448 family protein [Isoptericola sp. b441]|uniref:DUF6448 family protein n=1 Tax=Actinotalea lenta TaxID=3064654 RepID=A0ABT9DCU2_9CELL|nr:DUF6448 family protein [Isoptericola sp. b441]MDO8107126.1 DUF6448 family protein [Isoptericola sp. b441]
MATRRIRALIAALKPVTVRAHCDTADGPLVKDGTRALLTGNINHALKWIPVRDEDELRGVFDRAQRVRGAAGEATSLADQLFLETLARIHRVAEGAGFTGIKPSGTEVPAVVRAADAALESGTDADLLALLPEERRAELDRRFLAAGALADFDVDDVEAGRRYLDAYVSFVGYAEGEDRDRHMHHEPGRGPAGSCSGHEHEEVSCGASRG